MAFGTLCTVPYIERVCRYMKDWPTPYNQTQFENKQNPFFFIF
jgi:hypothetical protein